MSLLDSVPVPIDQLYFIFSQVTALLCALLYRAWDDAKRPVKPPQYGNGKAPVSPSGRIHSPNRSSCQGVPDQEPSQQQLANDESRNTALLFMAIPGLVVVYLCYGFQIYHLILMAVASYVALLKVSPQYIHWTTLGLSLGHLSLLHIDRLVNETPNSKVDITAPVMVLMQKVTIVAFGVYDGQWRAKQTGEGSTPLTADQKFHALERLPTFYEYMAYSFNFQTIICGPLSFYADFIEFVDGRKLKKAGLTAYPSAARAVFSKLVIAIGCGALMITFGAMYPAQLLTTTKFAETPFLSKLMFVYWVALASRLKYFLAWTLSESVCNASGLGFNGVDANTGKAKWNLMTNIDIYAFETALNQREGLLAWNKTTEAWLRRMAYDRAPKEYKLLGTYILSAIWHGFHPGYYLTFILGALFTQAARVARRCLRFRFQARGQAMFSFYHLLTWFATRIAMSYMVLPFILLDFTGSIRVYANMYFFAHLIAGGMILLLPVFFKPESGNRAGGIGNGDDKSGTQASLKKNGKDELKKGEDEAGSKRNGTAAGSGENGMTIRERPVRGIQETVSEKLVKYGAT